uniref:DUF148 domain-containing protein n=1 Tax=Meloidogyne hapla TaxID=6305 RepID=A0A1I8BCR7_MELHA
MRFKFFVYFFLILFLCVKFSNEEGNLLIPEELNETESTIISIRTRTGSTKNVRTKTKSTKNAQDAKDDEFIKEWNEKKNQLLKSNEIFKTLALVGYEKFIKIEQNFDRLNKLNVEQDFDRKKRELIKTFETENLKKFKNCQKLA